MVIEPFGVSHGQLGTLKGPDEDIGIVKMGYIAQFFAFSDLRPEFVQGTGTAGILGVTMYSFRQLRRLIITLGFFFGVVDDVYA